MVVTTSGNWYEPAFLCTLLALGADNILFAVDWPYEPNTTGIQFLRRSPSATRPGEDRPPQRRAPAAHVTRRDDTSVMGIEELAYLAARVLSCGLWLIVGLYKIAHYREAAEDMARHGIPARRCPWCSRCCSADRRW